MPRPAASKARSGTPTQRTATVLIHVCALLHAQEDALYIGRIVCDAEGALNEASLLLEGDVGTSGGMRVPLDLTLVSAVRLFHGQVSAA